MRCEVLHASNLSRCELQQFVRVGGFHPGFQVAASTENEQKEVERNVRSGELEGRQRRIVEVITIAVPAEATA